CPDDIFVNLDPGACNAILNFNDPEQIGGCVFQVQVPGSITQNLNTTTIEDAVDCGVTPTSQWRAYDLTAMGVNGSFTMNSITMGGFFAGTVQIFVYSYTGVLPSATLNIAQMVLVGQSAPAAIPGMATTTVNLIAPAVIPAGTKFVVEQRKIAGGPFAAAGNYGGETGPSYITCPGAGITVPTSYASFGLGFVHVLQVLNGLVTMQGPGTIVQTFGLPSGSTFPIGVTSNCFNLVNPATGEVVDDCCFDITVAEFPNPTTTLACNDNIQVSVNEECEAFVTTDMILEGGPYGCYDDYIVAVQGFGSGNGGVLINSNAIGQTLTVTITDPATGNSCWGTISVEDKIPPTIECRDVTIMCGAQLPDEPAPSISGPQEIVYSGLNDPLDLPAGQNITYDYQFDYSYLPAGTPVLDVDVQSTILDHTFTGDVNIQVISPSGTVIDVFEVGGCGGNFPIDTWFDDEGVNAVDCNGLDLPRILPIWNGGNNLSPNLFNLDGEDASGVWIVRIFDDFPVLDGGHILSVGLSITVNLPAVEPADNCGEVDLTFTDTETGDPCEGLIIVRHYVATDESGNTAACDQNITVLPLVLDSVTCPPAFVGSCGDDISPENTGWPTVNGNPITDDNNICNIFVGYWDKELNDCGEGTKIVRTWTILDWCTQTTLECVQVIKLSDNEAPILTCPSNITVGTDFWYCYANVSVPRPTVVDECGSSFVLSLTSSAGVVVNFGNNYVINQLPIGTYTLTWTATDECGNVGTCTFTITVEDDVVPVALCDEHTIVALTNDGPFGITLVPASVFDDGSYDNCGPVTFRARRMDSCIDFDWTTEGACEDDTPGGIPPVNSRDRGTVHRDCVPFACCDVGAGPIMVELEVRDASGNVNFCMVEITVQDKISPFVECPPDIIISCDFWFNVQEGTFVDADGNNNGNLDEDPLSAVFGNMFDAFQYNDDESVRQDIIINDPGNTLFSQPHFWGIDGWADDNCEVNLQVRVRVISDCSGDDLPANAPPGAVKLIERRFSASDGNEGIAPGTCTQRIYVVDFDPFYISDQTCNNADPNDGVIWPCNVSLTTCPEDLGDTGEPTIFDDACSLIGVAYEDTRFDFVDGACFKILREWSVIDWCQYDPITGEGLWHYVQVIKVHDNEGPEFEDCPVGPVVLCVADEGVSLPDNNQAFLGEDNPLASSCSAHLNLCKTVHETCSDFVQYDVKIYPFNGDEFILIKPTTTVPVDSNNNARLCFDTRQSTIQAIRLNGIPYNSPWCGDYHRILWSVEDGCGNWSTCEYLFRLEDCKQPSPVCINGLSTVVMPIGGQVTVWAKDFNASSFDDCTPAEELLYSFSGDSYQPSFTYNCDNVPAFGVELAVQIWVADFGTDDNCNGQISWNERNKDFCTTTIVITDNNGVCGDTTGSVLAGEILTEDVQSVEQVFVTLTSPNHVFPTYVTVEDGKYRFNNVILPENFTVNAERNDGHKNGVSTLDLVRIQKHLLGIETFSNPYDMIAADANNSQNISAIDLIELRKLILGIYTELPANKSWRFVDKSFQFADATNPWPFDESIDITNMISDQMDEDFVAIKIGDVNNTVQANAQQIVTRNGNGIVSFVAEDRTVNAGEVVEVAITSADFAGIEGYQFTLQTTGLEFSGVESGAISMTEENMGVFGNIVTTSWHKVGGVSATTSDVLFTIQFRATAGGQLSQMIALNSKLTEAEAYNTSSDIKDLKLTFRGAQTGAEFALYQNEPNPFKGNTVIGYDVPQSGHVTLTVFDVTGKVLTVKEVEAAKGYNTISVSSKELPSVGVLYYRLDANEYTATKKMIIIE
nr:HYR domain-containing protein [Bacteroidota bacterium]